MARIHEKPSDPSGIGTSAIERVRAELRRHDNTLDVWWNPSRACWRVMEYCEQNGSWSYCFDWRGPEGEFRQIDGCVPALVNKLAEMDLSRYGNVNEAARYLTDGVGRGRTEYLERKEAERQYNFKHTVHDYALRMGGVRQTVGFGKSAAPPRSRNFHRGADRGVLTEAAMATTEEVFEK